MKMLFELPASIESSAGTLVLKDATCELICALEAATPAEAEQIAHAINHHNALLAALEGMLDQSHLCGHDCDTNKPCPRGEAARAAIRQARGDA